jgi:membrane-associated protease RseP (regulator of RpoE activity)
MKTAIEAVADTAERSRLQLELGYLFLAQGNYEKAYGTIGQRNLVGLQTRRGDLGILVESVRKNGPADLAGILAGDTIVEFEGRSLANVDMSRFAREMVGKAPFGGMVKLKIARGTDRIEKNVIVGILPNLPELARQTGPASSPEELPAGKGAGDIDRSDRDTVPQTATSLDLENLVVEPSVMRAGQDFTLTVRFTVTVPGKDVTKIPATFAYSIVSGQKTLFESGPETYQADNGTPFRIIKTLGSSSIRGRYTIRVRHSYETLAAERSVEFAIN